MFNNDTNSEIKNKYRYYFINIFEPVENKNK